MSATRPSRQDGGSRAGTPAPRDISHLHARRREADRRRRLLRVDVALGVLVAILLLLVTPGVAMAAIFAALLLVLCVASVLLERRRNRPPGERRGSRTRAKAAEPKRRAVGR